ncbi:MAG: c-type cytochrome [Gemmatimonadales bacterium]
MRSLLCGLALIALGGPLAAQAPGHFPPDSLVNTKIFPHNTPVMQVVGAMRNFAGGLGVRCQFCHEGEEGQPLGTFDFASDKKQHKLIARQMMRMVEEINKRVDTLPGHAEGDPQVTCSTCHRGVNRPVPLSQLIVDAAQSSTDSAVRAYRALHQKYYGRDSYDFSENSLNTAAFRLARVNKFTEALAMLSLNEETFPAASSTAVVRGNVQLMKGDTAAAAAAYREAIKRDSTNGEARGRLRDIGQKP